jgi:predicted YcjX-like family ATPase
MGLLRVKTTECRIGVVGLYNAGKTVFLTSLLNHLESHDPDRFPLGKPGTAIRKFEMRPPDGDWSNFSYATFRDALVHGGKWPDKTTDRSMAACQFERSDWPFSDALVKLYDLPGERLADAAMSNRDFAAWSDHLLEMIRNDTPYRTSCAGFLDALSAPNSTEKGLCEAYKLALAKLILAFKPMISPSTFLLDTRGSAARPAEAEVLAAARYCGLGADSEFVPLSPEVRAAQPQLAAIFAARYERYKAEVVLPFLESLKSCNSLVVLVDVMMLLAGGVGMYDDNRQILRDLFHVLDPGETPMQKVGRTLAKVFLPHDLRPGWINRVAFVAPKLDLVHPSDRDRMLRLLKSMVGKLAENRDGLKYKFFNCAAVVSTKLLPSANGERKMVGVPYRGEGGRKILPGEKQGFTVSELPDEWPINWQPGEYAYPEVYPAMPTRKDCPPEQINLEKVLDFVLE